MMISISGSSVVRFLQHHRVPVVERLAGTAVPTALYSSCSAAFDDDTDDGSIRRNNKTLSRLIQTGRLYDARRLFDGLPRRSVVTWNSVISGYVRHHELAKARELFDGMPVRDVVSWNSMLLGYALSRETGELEEGRRLFDQMPERDVVSWNTMLRGYTRNGRLEDALLLFRMMPERNAVSWNTMMTGFLENGNVAEAIEMFETMPAHDPTSLSAVVSGLIQNGRLEDAESLLAKRCRMGETEGFIDAYNTLIVGYGRQGKVKEARSLFDMIPHRPCAVGGGNSFNGNGFFDNRGVRRNVVTWNSMMMCYVKAGDLCSARKLFDEMPKRDLFSWNTMISAYAQALDVQEASSLFSEMHSPDERTWNFMVSGFAQKGELGQARSYFDRMPHRNLVSWNTMIAGYERNGDCEGAIKLFSEMQLAGERPDQHSLSSVLGACAGLASLNLGVQIHQLITKTFIGDIPINNSLITMYARCGNLMDARSVFDDMKMQRDFISWNAMIGGYAQHGLARESLELFEKMKMSKVRPTNLTFISVLSACCHAGLVAEGQRQFDAMVQEFGIVPGVEHYALLVNLIGRNGQLEDAMNVIEGMLIPPDKSVWGALLGACKVHNNCDLARTAADALMELELNSAGPYVLLYNIYADVGRWEDATKVREVLDKKGIRKQPGYSWIELQKSLHIFLAGDRSHPLTSEIYALIDTCERTTRDESLEFTSFSALEMEL